MTTCDTYEESQSLLKNMLIISPEPRLYKYSIHNQLNTNNGNKTNYRTTATIGANGCK